MHIRYTQLENYGQDFEVVGSALMDDSGRRALIECLKRGLNTWQDQHLEQGAVIRQLILDMERI